MKNFNLICKNHVQILFNLSISVNLLILILSLNLNSQTWYRQSGGNVTLSNKVYSSSVNDTSGVFITNKGIFNLSNSQVTTSGNTSSDDNSSFYGLNAGILINAASQATIAGCNINTSGKGANGIFSTGTGTSVILENDTITCLADGGHGIDATMEGVMTVKNCVISTKGSHGAAISEDRGGGTITVNGGYYETSGIDSPGIYCTGSITVSDIIINAKNSEGVVIEGANTTTINNSEMTIAKGTRDRGVFIYQSMSGDAAGNKGTFNMTGSTINWLSTGPLFYITNTTGVINLKDVKFNNSSNLFIKASIDQWGKSGSNGGNVVFTADNETMTGDITTDQLSSVSLTMKNYSNLSGTINKAALNLDATSSWFVTETSFLSTLTNSAGISGDSVTNIIGNGHCVFYDSTLSGNSYLGKKTYYLRGGGFLTVKDCAVTSVNDEQGLMDNQYLIYPNPATYILNIQVNSNNAQIVKIYNMYSVNIYESIINGTNSIDISSWQPGIYFAMVNNQVQKIIVQH